MTENEFQLVVQPLATAMRTDGRRGAFDYFDLGLTAATEGALNGHYVTTYGPMRETSGWHYHDVDAQLIFMMKGWVDLEFEDGVTRRIDEGTFALIPGGLRHNQIGKSDETEAIEIVIGSMKTVECEPPD